MLRIKDVPEACVLSRELGHLVPRYARIQHN